MSDLQFTPQTDDSLEEMTRKEEEERLLSVGEGRFEVITSSSKVSQSGNPMIVVKMKVWDSHNKSGWIDEFLMAGEKSFFLKRIKSFCDAIGISDIYNSGKLDATDINSSHYGRFIIGVRKDKNGKLQNFAQEYIKKSADDTKQQGLDDDLPF